MQALTRAQVREVDRRAIEDFGIPGLLLMENASAAVAGEVVALLGGADRAVRTTRQVPVLILAGPGNNGGDGMAAARLLTAGGVRVRTVLVADPAKLTGDAAANLAILRRLGMAPEPFQPDRFRFGEEFALCPVMVDALLGTGLTRPPAGDLRTAIDLINSFREGDLPGRGSGMAPGRVLAVDVPSGLDADEGTPLGVAVRADVTVTFVAPKAGFLRPGAEHWTGRVAVAGIGVSPAMLDAAPAPDR